MERLTIAFRIDQWLTIMLACEHATKGLQRNARSFLETITGDELYNAAERYETITREVDALLQAAGVCAPGNGSDRTVDL